MSSGDKVDKYLSDTVRALKQPGTVRMGFLEGRTYPDGTSVPMVAAINEFGGTINMPARQQTVFKKLLKNGKFAKKGKFVKQSKSNFQSTHAVGAYTITIPSRPFFRDMLKKKSPTWAPALAKYLAKNKYDVGKSLSMLGTLMSDSLRLSIKEFDSPRNAKSTIRKKGFDKPLIDSSVMINSIDYEIVP